MSGAMDDEIKRWTPRRNAALVLEIIQGKATVAEAGRALGFTLDAAVRVSAHRQAGQLPAVTHIERLGRWF